MINLSPPPLNAFEVAWYDAVLHTPQRKPPLASAPLAPPLLLFKDCPAPYRESLIHRVCEVDGPWFCCALTGE